MVTIENLEKELKNNELKSIYSLYGEELFLLDNIVKKIKNKFGDLIKGINYISIDENSYKSLISEIETPAFGYEKKLIIIKNAGILSSEGKRKNVEISNYRDILIKYLKENIKSFEKNVILIFIENSADTRLKIYKTLDELGIVCKFEFQRLPQIKARIKAICNGYKVIIDENTLTYFIESCGTSMQELINEIRKLIEYVGENGKIEKKDIDNLSTKKFESVIFDLTDNLGKKDIKTSLTVLRNLVYAKEPVQKILITLYNHFKKIYLTKKAEEYRKDIATTLELKPNQVFLVNKYKNQARMFRQEDLRQILKSLADLDYNYKSGLINLDIGLESILCAYCS